VLKVNVTSPRDQVEAVLASGTGPTRSIILSISDFGDSAVIADATRRRAARRTFTSARRCLPSVGETGPDSAADDGVIDIASAKERAVRRLEPLTSNTRIARGLDQTDGGRAIRPEQLWAASAVSLDLPVEDLISLPEELGGAFQVYPNRIFEVPPIVTASEPAHEADLPGAAWGVDAIGALATWGSYAARGRGVVVAVLDTGVDLQHPDLAGKVVATQVFGPDGAASPDAMSDNNGHGTHVCGILAGGDASGKWIGVAPEASLAVAKVANDSGLATDAAVLAAVSWALEQGAAVINLSLSGNVAGPETPAVYTSAFATCVRRGAAVVAAVGNRGAGTSGSPGDDFLTLAVGAVDPEGNIAGFSGGLTQVVRTSMIFPAEALPLTYVKPELCAPGVGVLSAAPGGEWATLSGTSQASPHVAGGMAILLSATTIGHLPAIQRPRMLADLLLGTVDELGEGGQDNRYGYGRINMLRAVGAAHDRGLVRSQR
jgi:subtilisin family serine protease